MNLGRFSATIADCEMKECENMNRKLCIKSVGFMIIALVLLTSTAGAAAPPKPTPTPSPTDQILTVVTDIQEMVNTVLTRISALQTSLESVSTDMTSIKSDVASIQTSSEGISTGITSLKTDVASIQTSSEGISTDMTSLKSDVATIKTTTNTINDKVNAHPEPIRYEYYTTVVPGHLYDASSNTAIKYCLLFSNGGDTAAEVSYTIYSTINIIIDASGHSSSVMNQITQGNMQISGKQSKAYVYTNVINPEWTSTSPSDVLKFPILTIKITSNSPFVAPRLTIVGDNGPIDNYRPGDFQRVEIYN
jgi:archaellum component FlaC